MDIFHCIAGAKFHDYHHYAFNCNYASRLTFIDKAFGTYRVCYPPLNSIRCFIHCRSGIEDGTNFFF